MGDEGDPPPISQKMSKSLNQRRRKDGRKEGEGRKGKEGRILVSWSLLVTYELETKIF